MADKAPYPWRSWNALLNYIHKHGYEAWVWEETNEDGSFVAGPIVYIRPYIEEQAKREQCENEFNNELKKL